MPFHIGLPSLPPGRAVIIAGAVEGAVPGAAPEEPLHFVLVPVPRSITAGCGMCWSAPPDARQELEALVIREKLDVDGLYAVLL